MRLILIALLLLVVGIFGSRALAKTRMVEAGPDKLSEVVLLGELIRQSATQPLHIVYVHGMSAEAPDASAQLRAALSAAGFKETSREEAVYRKVDESWPPTATYAGQHIWTEESWRGSQPFRRRYRHGETGSIVIDEINWWPLLFPLKCKFLLQQEGKLSGVDEKHLRLCARDDRPYYPWLNKDELRKALGDRPVAGRGAWPNGMVKRQIFNWGLADAVVALGTMRAPITGAIEWAFRDLGDAGLENSHRVIVAESLGSFVVLDALARGKAATTKFVAATVDFYFFANQFALLELGRIKGVASASEDDASVALEARQSGSSPLEALTNLPMSDSSKRRGVPPRPRQIVAFSDPSDMLTWPVPCLSNIKVVNVLVPMTGGPLKLFAHPVRAHRQHLKERRVWDLLLRSKAADTPSLPGWTCPPSPARKPHG